MASSNQPDVEKVPRQSGDPLTPTFENRNDQFTALVSAEAPFGNPSPFQKSSLMARSPPRKGLQSAESKNDLETEPNDQETPKTGKPSQDMSPDERDAATARERVDGELKKMRKALVDMRTAVERQRNISMGVKNGLISLEHSLDVIESMRQLWRVAMERARIDHQERYSQTSPLMATAVTAAAAAKRPAASPPDTQREEKRHRDVVQPTPPAEEDGFCKVRSKKERKKARAKERRQNSLEEAAKVQLPKQSAKTKTTRSKSRNQVVLIKPAPGKTYADILGVMRKDWTPEDSGTSVRQVRKTANGGVLLELSKCENRGKLQEAIQKAVGDKGEIRSIVPKSRVEILDLDVLTTDGEVTTALRKDFPDLSGELKVTLFTPNRQEQRKAVVEMDQKDASLVLQRGKLRVGWVVCRVRKRLEVDRCFRCLGYGHIRKNCSGPDRSRNCWKCGGADHKAATCTGTPSCVLCTDTPVDHVPGSGACGAFRKALAEKKGRPSARR